MPFRGGSGDFVPVAGDLLFPNRKFILTGNKKPAYGTWLFEATCPCGEKIWRRAYHSSNIHSGCTACHGTGLTVHQRFLNSFIEGSPEECWNWLGTVHKYNGYPNISKMIDGREIKILGNRYALELKLGRPIKEGMLACHTCNNRKCVNPNHLYEGTIQSNVQDRERSGTTAKGSQMPHAVLNESIVREIKLALLPHTETNRSIAKRFGIRENLVAQIKAGNTWRHITI